MAKRGKPVEIDWNEFDRLCGIQCSLREIAQWFNCSEDSIERHVEKTHGVKFAEYFDAKRGTGKVALRRKMYDMAMSGDRVMLIWVSKNLIGWSEKIDTKQQIDTKVEVLSEISDEELQRRIDFYKKQNE